jgi:hypothetical protein
MGTGFVLIIWAIVGTLLASFAGVVLALICFAIQKIRNRVQRRWILLFAVAPFVGGVYLFVSFILYGIWCEGFRGRDFGIGDGFYFPITNGYTFNAIDTFDNPWLETPSRSQLHHDFEAIDAVPPLIFIKQGSNQFFIVDTASGSETAFPTEAEMTTSARAHGAIVHFQSPDEFYRKWRFTTLDLLAALLIYPPPVLVFLVLVFLFWRSLKSKPI